MEPTRLLRSMFGIPNGEPSYAAGVTIEKLVMISGPRAPPYKVVGNEEMLEYVFHLIIICTVVSFL